MSLSNDPQIIPVAMLSGYFYDAVTTSIRKQKLEASDDAAAYLVRLLTDFNSPNAIFEKTPDGVQQIPLAFLYKRAVESPSAEGYTQSLRKLGDIALFVVGVLPDSLSRSLVDVDYYSKMGKAAYGSLAVVEGGYAERNSSMFRELSNKFVPFSDVISDSCSRTETAKNTLRLYERWMKLGNKRGFDQLQTLGITPIMPNASSFRPN